MSAPCDLVYCGDSMQGHSPPGIIACYLINLPLLHQASLATYPAVLDGNFLNAWSLIVEVVKIDWKPIWTCATEKLWAGSARGLLGRSW